MKERRMLTLDTFLGVDFTTSPLKVDIRRAVSGMNFFSDYGTIKKRNGWIELVKFADKKITGMHRYRGFTVVRAGDKIYRLNDDMTYSTLYTIEQLADEQVSFFLMNNELYIVGLGKYLFLYESSVGVYTVAEVKDFATIPTTTISIDDEDAPTNNRQSLDSINLLTVKRKNSLLGRDATNLTWQLDGGIREVNLLPTQITVTVEYWDAVNEEIAEFTYKNFPNESGKELYLFDDDETVFDIINARGIIGRINGGTELSYFWEQVNEAEYEAAFNKYVEGTPTLDWTTADLDDWNNWVYIDRKITASGSEADADAYATYLENTLGELPAHTIIKYTNATSQVSYVKKEYIYEHQDNAIESDIESIAASDFDLWDLYGGSYGIKYISFNGTTYWRLRQVEEGSTYGSFQKITLYAETVPPVEGTDNITVEFESNEALDRSGIENATCGTIFGVNGQSNQLFLASGGIDRYSKAYDFKYFPDVYYNNVGNTENPIVGYSRLTDSSLVIYKAYETIEARMFVRTMSWDQDNLNYDVYQSAIDTEIGCDAPKSINNLNGDNLFLSKNGVFAVTLGANVSADERHVRERSMYINRKLNGLDIENGIAIVHNSYYYLAVDGHVFVADARYKSTSRLDDTFNYEWYYWLNIPVTSWIVINNELYFGTEEGRLCKFDDLYSDRTLIKASEGEVTLVVDGNYLVYNQAIEISENDEIYVDTYRKLIDASHIVSYTGGLITLDINAELYLTEGDIVYASGAGLTNWIPYIVTDLDGNTFKLESDDVVVVPIDTFSILDNLLETKMYVTGLDTENSQFRLKASESGSPVELVAYDENPITFTIIVHEPVELAWYSKILDLGTNVYAKTLYRMSVSADGSTEGVINFGFDTRNISNNIQSLNFQDFTFEDIDFNNFTFLTAIASSYTKQVKEKDFNFIILKIGSETNSAAVINSLSLEYKFNHINKGIR